MTREMTPRQEQVLELRRARMSYRQIARHLGITNQTVQEIHAAALKYVDKIPPGYTPAEWRRIEEADYIDGVLRRYMAIADNAEKPQDAINALNGAHRYVDSIIKLQGLNAPVRVETNVTITNNDLEAELVRVESEIVGNGKKQITK